MNECDSTTPVVEDSRAGINTIPKAWSGDILSDIYAEKIDKRELKWLCSKTTYIDIKDDDPEGKMYVLSINLNNRVTFYVVYDSDNNITKCLMEIVFGFKTTSMHTLYDIHLNDNLRVGILFPSKTKYHFDVQELDYAIDAIDLKIITKDQLAYYLYRIIEKASCGRLVLIEAAFCLRLVK